MVEVEKYIDDSPILLSLPQVTPGYIMICNISIFPLAFSLNNYIFLLSLFAEYIENEWCNVRLNEMNTRRGRGCFSRSLIHCDGM